MPSSHLIFDFIFNTCHCPLPYLPKLTSRVINMQLATTFQRVRPSVRSGWAVDLPEISFVTHIHTAPVHPPLGYTKEVESSPLARSRSVRSPPSSMFLLFTRTDYHMDKLAISCNFDSGKLSQLKSTVATANEIATIKSWIQISKFIFFNKKKFDILISYAMAVEQRYPFNSLLSTLPHMEIIL